MPLKTLSGRHADPRKGRGAATNPEGRFETTEREAFDDGWSAAEHEELRPLKTQVTVERAKSIISHNDSPDLGFSQSINPYAGCEHGCPYCLSGDTRILMGDGVTRSLADVRSGDVIYGTERRGSYRRYVRQHVLAHWSVIKPAYRITLADGTGLTAGGDHRFLTERGWKFVTGERATRGTQRPYLTTNNKLMGTGGCALPPAHDDDYQRGYLCGVVRGDGLLASYHYLRVGRIHGDQHQFRLALCDPEALQRTQEFLQNRDIATHQYVFQKARAGRREMPAIRTHARRNVDQIREVIAWPTAATKSWVAGFLAGIFDAEGSYSRGVLRISNTDAEIIRAICESLQTFGFCHTVELGKRDREKPVDVVRVDGGLSEHLRFFHSVDTAVSRKRDIEGQAVKSAAMLQVVSIQPIGTMRLYDLTTETEDFIANGVVSHNCYARPSHAYRNLSPGIDFETRLFAKVNAAELLRIELSRPGYKCEKIMIGANTDPYQPIERQWKITRSVLDVCAEFNQPIGIISKNAGIERDIDVLAPMAKKRLATVTISCNNLDHEIARRLEPRCSAPKRRLEAVRNLSDAGIAVCVLVAPVVPFLTDDQIEPVLEAAAAHGAKYAGYTLLRLPWEVNALFKEWLERNYPLKAKHVMSRVREMREGRENDSSFGSRMVGAGLFAELLERRFAIACRRLDLNFRKHGDALDTMRFRVPGAGSQLSLF